MLLSLDNLPYWILLGVGLLFFLIILGSGIAEADADVDAEADLDADAGDGDDLETGGNLALALLGWFGIGKAPLLLLLAFDLSVWGLLGWMLNVWVGTLFGQMPTGFLTAGVLIGSFVAASSIGGWVARPIGRIMASFGEDTSADRLLGRVGTVSSGMIPKQDSGKIGQVDVRDAAGNLITISAVLPDWAEEVAERGQSVLVIDRSEQSYVVITSESQDQDRWMQRSPT